MTAHEETPTDSIGLTDSAQRTYGKVKTDNLGLTDAAARSYGKAATDALGLVDAAARAYGVEAIDAVGGSDAMTRTYPHHPTETDRVSIRDAVTTYFIQGYRPDVAGQRRRKMPRSWARRHNPPLRKVIFNWTRRA